MKSDGKPIRACLCRESGRMSQLYQNLLQPGLDSIPRVGMLLRWISSPLRDSISIFRLLRQSYQLNPSIVNKNSMWDAP